MPAAYTTEARAREFAAALAEREAETGALVSRRRAAKGQTAEGGETVDAWHARFLASITATVGASYLRTTASTWKTWVSPVIGAKPMAGLTRDDVEDVRDELDRAIASGRMSPKHGANVWSVVVSAMKAAAAAKDRSLRVHAAPLSYGILPPTRGHSRARPWLYPTEFLAMWNCAEIPESRRRLYALGTFLALRPAELRALRYGDVDLVAKVVRVSKAHDAETGEEKAPKTRGGLRSVPIPEALLPLLSGPHDPTARVVAAAPWEDLARLIREDLRRAGVTRERLFASTTTEEPCDFRSLRDTGATWAALSGVDLATLKRRLGHEDVSTTDRYIRAAGEVHDAEAIGEPFPDLGAKPARKLGREPRKLPRLLRKEVAPVGLEPSQVRETTTFPVDSCQPTGEPMTPIDAQVRDDTLAVRNSDPVREALADALRAATRGGEWATVAEIARALAAGR